MSFRNIFLVKRYLFHSLQLLLSPGSSVLLHIIVRPLRAGQTRLGFETPEVRILVDPHVHTCTHLYTPEVRILVHPHVHQVPSGGVHPLHISEETREDHQPDPHLVLGPVEGLGGVPEVGPVLVGADRQGAAEPTLVTEVFVSPGNSSSRNKIKVRASDV